MTVREYSEYSGRITIEPVPALTKLADGHWTQIWQIDEGRIASLESRSRDSWRFLRDAAAIY